MTQSAATPDLSFVVPAASENRWSDLLATMIATDPCPIASLLGIECDAVRREVVAADQVARKSDRLDLLLSHEGRDVAAIEVKLLSDLGPKQLVRYRTAFPSVDVYRVLHLARLPVNLQGVGPWESLTWESMLDAYARSEHPWVATTASAWVSQLDSLVPPVATAWIENGVSLRAVADLLGHANPRITIETYAHTSDDAARGAMRTLGDLIGLEG